MLGLQKLLRTVVLVSTMLSICGTPLGAQESVGPDTEIDRSIKPGDDFYRYANGEWLRAAAIKYGESTFDNRAILTGKASQRVRDLIQGAAASHPTKGSIAQKVGDYYTAFMIEAA